MGGNFTLKHRQAFMSADFQVCLNENMKLEIDVTMSAEEENESRKER